jgi:putative oxidoreductase
LERALAAVDPAWGITVIRVMAGIILIVAGYMKFAGGLGGFSGFIGSLGFPAPGVLGPLVAVLELVGGLLVLVGFKVRWIALLIIVEFLVTTFLIKLRGMGWDATRTDSMMLAAAIMLVLAGAGKASLGEMWSDRSR